jgi:hypothetical protein
MKKFTLQKTVALLRVLYPIWAVVGIFGILYVPSTLIVPGDAAATAHNIMSHEFLFRAGIVGNLITQLLFIFVVLLLYKLFEETDKNLSVWMTVLALVSVPIAMVNELNNMAALLLQADPGRMKLFLDLNARGVTIASIFWGLWLFPLGVLIRRSGYFPGIIGLPVLIAGFGYTLGSFLKLLAPNLETVLTVLNVMTFGEIVFLLWLVFRGVRPKAVESEARG